MTDQDDRAADETVPDINEKTRQTLIGGAIDPQLCRRSAAFYIEPTTCRAVYVEIPETPCPRCGTPMQLFEPKGPYAPGPYRQCEQPACVEAVRAGMAERAKDRAPKSNYMRGYRRRKKTD